MCTDIKILHTEDTNLLTCVDISTNTMERNRKRGRKENKYIMCHVSFVMCHVLHATCHVSYVMCQMSCVAFHLSPFTCHLSLTPTVKATDPSHANSPTMRSRLVCKDPKLRKILRPKKLFNRQEPKNVGRPILAICSVTRSLQSTGKQGFQM